VLGSHASGLVQWVSRQTTKIRECGAKYWAAVQLLLLLTELTPAPPLREADWHLLRTGPPCCKAMCSCAPPTCCASIPLQRGQTPPAFQRLLFGCGHHCLRLARAVDTPRSVYEQVGTSGPDRPGPRGPALNPDVAPYTAQVVGVSQHCTPLFVMYCLLCRRSTRPSRRSAASSGR
jgi:hypothetical protein